MKIAVVPFAMAVTGFVDLLLLSSCLVAIGAVPALSSKKHHPHQTRDRPPQKCDLVCPGQRPLLLPPGFLQNCSSVPPGAPGGPPPSSSTTPRPIRATTTESSDESTESSTEETRHKRGNGFRRHSRHHSRGVHSRMMEKKAETRLLGRLKKLRGRARLDGCYVVCEDDQNTDDADDGDDDGSDSGEDNYVEGEDAAVEIIYVPPQAGESRRPSDLYQVNNYELVDPPPLFGVEPSILWQEKRKKMKKRKRGPGKRKGPSRIEHKKHVPQ